jgi:hypothetical protein
MKFPEKKELLNFYQGIRDKCFASRNERAERYDMYRAYYLRGSVENDCGGFNKIYPHIDQLTSFMYSQETTKFAVTIGANVSSSELGKVPALNQAVNDEWHSSNGDIVFGMCLTWAFVYGTELIKLRWNKEQVEPFPVDPRNFGVYREDVQGLHRQEAVAHEYHVPRSQLERELQDHPRKADILSKLTFSAIPAQEQSSTMSEVVITATQPQITGDVNFDLNSSIDYMPIVKEDMAKLCELYIWDDDESDYRVVTMGDPTVLIYDRCQGEAHLFVKAELPFIQVCPTPTPGYFWGIAEVERLKDIQELRNKRMRQIDHMMELQAEPPVYASGFDGDVSEMQTSMNTPGGMVNTENMGAKLDKVSPTIPDDMFKEITQYDMMFEEMSGITNVMQGRGEAGVRSQSHASKLAQLGSSRAKKRALIVEDCLEKMATLYLHILKVYDGENSYRSEDGTEFIAQQFTKDFVVKVDSHSNSPIFAEDQRAMAFELFKAKAITREKLLELLDVPMKQLLKQDLKNKIEPAEAKAAQQQLAAEAQGKAAKHGKPARPNA